MSFTVETIEDADGNVILPIPQEMLDSLKWKEGDTLSIDIDENNTVILRLVTNG